MTGVGHGFDSYRGNRTSPTTNPSTGIEQFPDACEVGSSRFIPARRCLAMMKLSSEVPNFCRRIYKKSRRLIDLSGRWKSGFRHPATSTIQLGLFDFSKRNLTPQTIPRRYRLRYRNAKTPAFKTTKRTLCPLSRSWGFARSNRVAFYSPKPARGTIGHSQIDSFSLGLCSWKHV